MTYCKCILGKDGKDGKDGKEGRNGMDGEPGRSGMNGQDGMDYPGAEYFFTKLFDEEEFTILLMDFKFIKRKEIFKMLNIVNVDLRRIIVDYIF